MTTHRGASSARSANIHAGVDVDGWAVSVEGQGRAFADAFATHDGWPTPQDGHFLVSDDAMDDAIARVLGASGECPESAFGIPLSEAIASFDDPLAPLQESGPPPPYQPEFPASIAYEDLQISPAPKGEDLQISPAPKGEDLQISPVPEDADDELDSDDEEMECTFPLSGASEERGGECDEPTESKSHLAEEEEGFDSDDEVLQCDIPLAENDDDFDSDEEMELECAMVSTTPAPPAENTERAACHAVRDDPQSAPHSPPLVAAKPIARPCAPPGRKKMAGSKRSASDAGHAVSERKRCAWDSDELECASQIAYPAVRMDEVEGYTDGTTSSSASSDTSDSCASNASEDAAPVLGTQWGHVFTMDAIAAQAKRESLLCRVFVNTHVMQLPVGARGTPVGAEMARLRKSLMARNGAALAQPRKHFSNVMTKSFKNHISEINVFLNAQNQIDAEDLEILWLHCGRSFLFFVNSLMLSAVARYYFQEGK